MQELIKLSPLTFFKRYVLTLGIRGVHPLCPREKLRKVWAAPELNVAQWYAFLDPERLAVDLERGRLRRSGRTGRARRARNSAGHASRAAAAETKIGDVARANAKKSSSANASTSVAARARASLEGSNDSTRPSSGRKR